LGEVSEQAPAAGDGKRSGFLRRLFAAQEAGLVIVIALMMLGLTVFSGTIEQPVRVDVATEAQVDERIISFDVVRLDEDGNRSVERVEAVNGELPARHADARSATPIREWSVTTGDSVRVFSGEEGWSLNESRSTGSRSMTRRVEVNRFLNVTNLTQVATYASFIAIMAVGMTAIIVLAGIDLSIGSVYGLAAFAGALALRELDQAAGWYVSVPIGLVVCVIVGAACGFANGAMTVGFRVHPFVVTLGMMAALRGLIFVLSKGQSVGEFPTSYTSGFFKAEIAGVYPVPVFIMVAVCVVGVFILQRTVFGRQVFAIGGNETAARYAGIRVGRVKIIAFTVAGALAGLSGAVYCGFFGAAEPGAGNAYELQVIAATVIGGTSLMGGRGSALGAVLGAIIIQLINNGILILEIDQQYNQILMGAAIIVAVVIDQAKSRLGARKR
jgi:ribose/xylose/arabinose/galactoside ABC-type transport system permease subunit